MAPAQAQAQAQAQPQQPASVPQGYYGSYYWFGETIYALFCHV